MSQTAELEAKNLTQSVHLYNSTWLHQYTGARVRRAARVSSASFHPEVNFKTHSQFFLNDLRVVLLKVHKCRFTVATVTTEKHIDH